MKSDTMSPPQPLDHILAVERETAVLVEAERAKASKWLDETKRAIDEAGRAEIALLNDTTVQREAAAKATAAEKAAAIVDDANAFAARLAAVDDDRLRPIVWKHIAGIAAGSKP